ncbi:MAG: single-stranded DNA-binding protein [Planctomycetota bacterium]
MASYNKVLLMGNLTRDIEMRALPSGTNVASFGLAVNERYKDRDGTWQERANFVDCEMFGARGEAMAKYLSKGSPVFVEGKLRLDQWQDREGNNRSKLKVVAESFEFIDSRGGGDGGARSGGGRQSQPAGNRNDGGGGGGGGGYGEPVSPDDIPF